MLFGFNAALSGMRVNANRMRVSANNIANINSPGFKAGRAVSQSLGQDMGAATTTIQTDTSQGAVIFTGNSLDLAIQGEGYFQVTLSDGTTGYSRQSIFSRDSSGRMTDAGGNVITPGITIPSNATSVSINRDGQVTAMVNGSQTTLGTIELAGFSNPSGLAQAGGGVFLESAASGQPTAGTPGSGGLGQLMPGSIESSNVDLTQEIVNMIMSKHGYAASAKTVKTADEMLGTLLDIKG